MTEEEWLRADDPRQMLGKRGSMSERQLLLFGCACCRFRWELLTNSCCQQSVLVAERYADRHATAEELRKARNRVEEEFPNIHWTADFQELFPHKAAWLAAIDTVAAREFEEQHALGDDSFDDMLAALKDELSAVIANAAENAGVVVYWRNDLTTHCQLLQDIIGNPFRPLTLDPIWLTSTVVALAEGIYQERAFDRMPILADALQDAGCDNAEVLDHCRCSGPHVRGCWVIDQLLGKR